MYHRNLRLDYKRDGNVWEGNSMADETDLNFVDVLNAALPFEKHLPGMRCCGPGTRLDRRLDENGKPLPGNEPVDRVDEAALKHDLAYSKYEI